jgi:hypothetical protein
MNRPKKGIRSTQPTTPPQGPKIHEAPALVPEIAPLVLPVFDAPCPFHNPTYSAHHNAHVIPNNKSIANIFCYGAFADEISGVVYNDLTGNFQFMSIDESVCFFIIYHYKTNAILVNQLPTLMIVASLMHTKIYLKAWRARDTNRR